MTFTADDHRPTNRVRVYSMNQFGKLQYEDAISRASSSPTGWAGSHRAGRPRPPPRASECLLRILPWHHALVASLVILAAGAARAGDPSREVPGDFEQLSLDALLNPTITTATKSARTLEQTPSIVSVFGREDIERLGARQLIDLLRFVPGFYEVGSELERNVAIRGIHASSPYHFVVLLDGLPMNDFLFSSSSPDSFSLELAERVEIIRGPGSAIYGANALMGVVNIITRKAATRRTCTRRSAPVSPARRAGTSASARPSGATGHSWPAPRSGDRTAPGPPCSPARTSSSPAWARTSPTASSRARTSPALSPACAHR